MYSELAMMYDACRLRFLYFMMLSLFRTCLCRHVYKLYRRFVLLVAEADAPFRDRSLRVPGRGATDLV